MLIYLYWISSGTNNIDLGLCSDDSWKVWAGRIFCALPTASPNYYLQLQPGVLAPFSPWVLRQDAARDWAISLGILHQDLTIALDMFWKLNWSCFQCRTEYKLNIWVLHSLEYNIDVNWWVVGETKKKETQKNRKSHPTTKIKNPQTLYFS